MKLEQRTRELLLKCYNSSVRKRVAREILTTSEELNEFLRGEVKSVSSDDVISAIMENINFRMEQETLEVMANSEYEEDRIRAAIHENATLEFLEDMYSKETEQEVIDVIENRMLFMIPTKSSTLTSVQKRQILKVLKELKKSKYKSPLSKYVKKILDIIG